MHATARTPRHRRGFNFLELTAVMLILGSLSAYAHHTVSAEAEYLTVLAERHDACQARLEAEVWDGNLKDIDPNSCHAAHNTQEVVD